MFVDQKSEGVFGLTRRGFHTELGAREKALLAEDPALTRFKSHKKDVRRIKKVGDLLTIIVVAETYKDQALSLVMTKWPTQKERRINQLQKATEAEAKTKQQR
ncbi:hypothetical protein QQ045_002397 [Rhodiola kirilowii]